VPGHFAVVQWNDPDHLRRRVKEFAGQIAAIAFEPVLCNTCCIEPVEGMLKTIRELCDEHGIVMIADETITGFRFGPAGAQGYYGVDADIMIYGKAVGGGVPFAGFSGRRKFFEKILNGQVIHAGTLNANPLCLAASKWCLDEILHRGDSHPGVLNWIGSTLMEGLRGLADRHGVPLRPNGPGLVFHTIMLKPGAPEGRVMNHRDYMRRHDAARFAHLRKCLLEEGVRAIERGLWFVGFEHRDADIQEALERADVAFARHASEWNAPA
jgi:glutamate-1-semialdehyde 2,1-aminomutase